MSHVDMSYQSTRRTYNHIDTLDEGFFLIGKGGSISTAIDSDATDIGKVGQPFHCQYNLGRQFASRDDDEAVDLFLIVLLG